MLKANPLGLTRVARRGMLQLALAMTELCVDGACVCNAALPDKQVCAENFVVRQNGCGETLETIEECSGGAQCVDGACVNQSQCQPVG